MLGKDLMCAKEWVMVPLTEPRNTAGCVCVCAGLVAKSCLTVTPWTVAHRLLCPWDFSGKNTGAGCHSLLQGNLPDPGVELASPES